MCGCKITLNHIRNVLWDMFPDSVRMLWDDRSTITVHYFGRDDEMFCCVGDKWWHVAYRWVHYLVNEEEGYDWYPHVDSIKEVGAPTDVVYSHTLIHPWDYEEPVSERPCDVTRYIGYDMGDDLMLRS